MAASRSTRHPRMIKPRPRPLWHLILSAVVVSLAIVLLLVQLRRSRGPSRQRAVVVSAYQPCAPATVASTASAWADTVRARISPCLGELGIWADLVRTSLGRKAHDEIAVEVPEDVPLPLVNYYIARLVQAAGGHVLRAEETRTGRRVEIQAGFRAAAATRFVLQRRHDLHRRTGRIALIICDDAEAIDADDAVKAGFRSLPPAVTFVVDAHRSIQAERAAAAQGGHEILLRLPPVPAANTADDVDSAMARLGRKLDEALQHVPAPARAGCLLDSQFAADPPTVAILFDVLQRRGLALLDGRRHTDTSIAAAARQMHVPFAAGDLFLDRVDDPQAIEQQLFKLADVAGRTGSAIGIAHQRLTTLRVLQRVIPRLQTRGHRLVPFSRLTR